jgi:hypothetical protein
VDEGGWSQVLVRAGQRLLTKLRYAAYPIYGTTGQLKRSPSGRKVFRMTTVRVIRNGSTYLGQHLRKNDY